MKAKSLERWVLPVIFVLSAAEAFAQPVSFIRPAA
jgi:hypothetical protein